MIQITHPALRLVLAVGLCFAGVTDAVAQTPDGPAGMAFYNPPSPLPPATHGTPIWMRDAPTAVALPGAARNLLVLYQSLTLEGVPVAVSGTVSIPRGRPPEGGWPLITWTHGTTGISPACAPSLDVPGGTEHYYLGPSRERLDGLVRLGYAVVFSDFQGLGVTGGSIHPFLQGEAEARGALDIMRAARQIDRDIGESYAVMGHSEGGQAALFTAQFGPSYVPELSLLGTVAFAPASDMAGRIQGLTSTAEPSGALVYAMYFLQSVASNHSDIDLRRILTPQALDHLPQTQRECVSPTLAAGYWATAIPRDQFIAGADLASVMQLALANDPGRVRISAPVFIMQGSADVTVPPGGTDLVASSMCANGNELLYSVLPGADHESVVQQGNEAAIAWVQARFQRLAATSNCSAGAPRQ
ncbi:MAG: secretory lipase precursor [Rubritepida sp.]|nr:secretory lipase precursor [Rubritepida sp.]